MQLFILTYDYKMVSFLVEGGGDTFMTTTVVTTKGLVLIPSRIRRRLKLTRGTKVSIEEGNNTLVLRPVTAEYFDRIAGILPSKGKLTKMLSEERAKDRHREEGE
jgi:AbrB family looped-hinge helix DNA binding protein